MWACEALVNMAGEDIYMEDYRKMVRELSEKREQNEKTIEGQIRHLGEYLTGLEPSELDKTPLRDPQKQAKDLASISVEDRKKIHQITTIDA